MVSLVRCKSTVCLSTVCGAFKRGSVGFSGIVFFSIPLGHTLFLTVFILRNTILLAQIYTPWHFGKYHLRFN